MGKGLWVLVQHDGKEVHESTFEILTEARRLADKLGTGVTALLLGEGVAQFSDTLGQYADNVYLVEHPLLAQYTTDSYVMTVNELAARKEPPFIILISATALGRDLAPRLAMKLKAGLVSNCVILKINEGVLEMTRPIYGGRIYATMICPAASTQVVSMRPGVIGIDKPRRGRPVEVEKLEVELKPEAIHTRILGYTKVDRKVLDITEAEAVVAFGRGMGDKSALANMEVLAELLHASIAGSRPAVDAGWIPFERQIGQTGRTISPKFIICSGISGASQFVMGMQDSKFIVAVNADRQAPIFKVADISIVGDLNKIVPALIEQLHAASSAQPQAGKGTG